MIIPDYTLDLIKDNIKLLLNFSDASNNSAYNDNNNNIVVRRLEKMKEGKVAKLARELVIRWNRVAIKYESPVDNVEAQFQQQSNNMTSTGMNPRDQCEKYKSNLNNIITHGKDKLVEGLKCFIEADINENVSMVISRQLLTEVRTILVKLEDSVSKALSHFTLEVVKPRMISFEDQVVAIRQHLADIYEWEQNRSEYKSPVNNVKEAVNNNDEPQPKIENVDVKEEEEETKAEKSWRHTVLRWLSVIKF